MATRIARTRICVLFFLFCFYKFFDENGVWDWITKHHAANIAGTMKAEQPWIEETREFFGLLIIIVILLTDYFYSKKDKLYLIYEMIKKEILKDKNKKVIELCLKYGKYEFKFGPAAVVPGVYWY